MDEKLDYAKSLSRSGRQPTVQEHLQAVAQQAGAFGAKLGMEEPCRMAGLFHDVGKYGDIFKEVLAGKATNVDHAICGAAILLGSMDDSLKLKRRYRPVMEAINGHHTGLMELELLEPALRESLVSEHAVSVNERKVAALAGPAAYQKVMQKFRRDFPHFKAPSFPAFSASDPALPAAAQNVESMLHARMLFSCLVDADYTVSAADDDPEDSDRTACFDFDPQALLEQLYAHRAEIRRTSTAEEGVNRLRDKLFDRCYAVGEREGGLFALTAPTGTGKTLALLHFALRHCQVHGKRRIIVVLPFLTLAEQNADTYAKIIPELLVDHSQRQLGDEAREFAARWNVPFILTTSVRFFETLFAQRATDCRKLHNIANSVILFDESQSLPPEVTSATLWAAKELCRRYRCTMVFSSATQPCFDALPQVAWKPVEIMPEHSELFRALSDRTQVEWRLQAKTPLEEIAREMQAQNSVCAIVNLRRHAAILYRLLGEQSPAEETFFLTTDLCPAHRSRLVKTIVHRLGSGLPCRVVATQCIEAGVDLDFQCMYRALAPLESIIQAAGRCNRNGKYGSYRPVIVFEPDEPGRLYPGDWYENAAILVKQLSACRRIDIHNPEDIERYYRELFKRAQDKAALTEALENRSFSDTEQAYRLIDNQGVRVIVPYEGEKALYEFVRAQALQTGMTPALMCLAAPITVTAFARRLSGFAENLRYSKRGRPGEAASDYHLLLPQCASHYTGDMGLQLPEKATYDWMWKK
ncbi:MAG: CRISPR-associated helicase Cas3' [Clostridiales bacterium]|nr:CRISPR-associated helicase Cas3' [Clostridiales bacterium]